MTEPRSAAQEAGDPRTSADRLLELTEKHPQLHRLIVLNPATPEVARQWILATNPWAKQAYEANQQGDAADGDAAADGAAPGSPAEDTATADAAGVSVWGDLGSAPEPGPAPAPPAAPAGADAGAAGTPAPTVRIAENAPVVPLGPTPASPAAPPPSPSDAGPAVAAATAGAAAAPTDWGYDAPPAPGAHDTTRAGAPPMVGAAAAPAAAGGPGRAGDGEGGTRRRAWYACGGCLVLALLLVLVAALVGRAWLSDGDDQDYQRDSSTSAAEESPAEEPSEEPEETPSPDPVSPAPEGAHEMTELRSPTGNISCLLEEDSVACSVVERDFDEAGLEDCDDGPFSIQVADGEAERACGTSFLSESGPTLEYDESATYGDMACTSRFDGMTCWNTLTGNGFMVNRATYETF